MTLIFLNVPAHGHVNPTLPLVKELVARGRHVIYYNGDHLRARIERTGAEFRAYPGLEYDPENVDPNPARLAATLMDAAERLLPWLLDEVAQEAVSAILYDAMTVWGWYLAEITGYRSINSTATMVLDQGVLREVGAPGAMMGQLLTAIPDLWRMRQTGIRLQKKYGIRRPPLDHLFVNPGDLNLVYTSRAFQPQAARFGDDYHFVGISVPDEQPQTDLPLDQLAGRKVIYASLGTLFNNRPDFFRACLEAFAGDDYGLVMAVGNKINPAALGPLRENAIVRPFVPQLAVLEQADLFITHGGANSINEGLYHGVPLLLFPQMVEQGFGARRVEDLGAGLLLRDRDLEPGRLRELADRILTDDEFKDRAMQIGASYRTAGGFRRAADAVEAFIDGDFD